MTPAALMPLAALFPLLLATLTGHPRLRRHLLLLLPPAALPALLTALLLPDGATLTLPNALLEASWSMDPAGRIFLLFTATGWILASLAAVSYFKTDPRKGRFAVPFLIAMSGNLLLPAAADAVTFYTGFAVMSFASWALVVYDGTPAARRAGRLYLALVVLGELMVFPGLVKGALWAETADLAAIRAHWALDPDPRLQIALIFAGFAIKAGLFPLHIWLPLAHPVAPAPASAVLSGCMIKAGLLAWIRLIPFGEFAMPALATLLTALAAAGLLLSLTAGLTQTAPKALLAYSSISKMSLMMLLLVPALREPALTPAALTAVLLYAAVHALHKVPLFLGAALTPRLGPWARLPLLLLCASFAALPGLSGALVKLPVKTLHQTLTFPGAALHPHLFALASVLTLLLMARFYRLTAPHPQPGTPPPSRGILLTWLLATATALALPPALRLLPDTGLPTLPLLPQLTAWTDPALLTGLTLLLLLRILPLPTLPVIPPGDLLHLLPRLPARTLNALHTRLQQAETRLSQPAGGLIYISLILLFLLLLSTP